MEMSDTSILGKKQGLDREGSHLIVDSIEQVIPATAEVVFNPNIMGNARIRGSSLEESSSAPEVSGAFDPKMDAYLQTQMAEEAAAELARGQDRKPIVEN